MNFTLVYVRLYSFRGNTRRRFLVAVNKSGHQPTECAAAEILANDSCGSQFSVESSRVICHTDTETFEEIS
jgi:hypothetical protein